ncbi:MAG: circularly permuted type 2 ATP-grasp protein, partial [Pedobacter sp.]|nr:circularly permuted type 2 ATP-grasp protein [Pedobacter sp.]
MSTIKLNNYQNVPNTWDEMYISDNNLREQYHKIINYLEKESASDLNKKEELAKSLFMSQGITFTVYDSGEGIEKIFPFDIIPRVITSSEWSFIERGIKQRLKALNLFLKDVYSTQFIIKDGVIPATLIYSCPHFLREMYQLKVPHDIYTHIAGIDLIRDFDGTFYVLEDNLRTPSGVSYMLENREITKRLFPDLIPQCKVRSVTEYPSILYKNLLSLSPRAVSNPTIVLLSPGMYNSAYYEHTTLARLMGVELVEGRDLVVRDHKVFMKTTTGLQQVDVIYRRVDDDFIDPLVFNPSSVLGVAGLMSAYRKGNVAIINAVGNGVADDKAVYSYVPDMIKYYLNEEPLLKNVPTYGLDKPDEQAYVFENINKMVIKKTNGSGGYGMLMGHASTES